jgi:hypothetical protein
MPRWTFLKSRSLKPMVSGSRGSSSAQVQTFWRYPGWRPIARRDADVVGETLGLVVVFDDLLAVHAASSEPALYA